MPLACSPHSFALSTSQRIFLCFLCFHRDTLLFITGLIGTGVTIFISFVFLSVLRVGRPGRLSLFRLRFGVTE